MPASTEKNRNSGVRKVETTGLTPMAMPSGMASHQRQHRADQNAPQAGADMRDERAVLDAFDTGLRSPRSDAETAAG